METEVFVKSSRNCIKEEQDDVLYQRLYSQLKSELTSIIERNIEIMHQ